MRQRWTAFYTSLVVVLPALTLGVFTCAAVLNWAVGATSPTVEWLEMQAAATDKRVNDIQISTDAQSMAVRERLAALETTEKEHGRKLDDIESHTRTMMFGIFGTLASVVLKLILAYPSAPRKAIRALAGAIPKGE